MSKKTVDLPYNLNNCDNLLKLKVDYLSKRLDHTLTHTDSSNKTIYLVDGAFLALVSFAIKTIGIDENGYLTQGIVRVAAVAVLLLATINLFHARLLTCQGRWYRGLDNRIKRVLSEPLILPENRSWHESTHGLYAAIHYLIALSLVSASTMMLCYSMGFFGLIRVFPKHLHMN